MCHMKWTVEIILIIVSKSGNTELIGSSKKRLKPFFCKRLRKEKISLNRHIQVYEDYYWIFHRFNVDSKSGDINF